MSTYLQPSIKRSLPSLVLTYRMRVTITTLPTHQRAYLSQILNDVADKLFM